MNVRLWFLLTGLFAPILVFAQFSEQGVIYYERKVNLKLQAQLEEEYAWAKRYLERLEEGVGATFRLAYSGQTTNYEFIEEAELPARASWMLDQSVAYKNHVWSDYAQGQQIALKQVYEKTYRLEDSMTAPEWKLSEEIRVIAGYTCRKALTTLFDSVVVVAFYTDEIMVSGGPEGFQGLPGMILGVAVPRLYTTWFATKVELRVPEPGELQPPKGGEPVSRKALSQVLEKVIKRWGDSGRKMLWRVFL